MSDLKVKWSRGYQSDIHYVVLHAVGIWGLTLARFWLKCCSFSSRLAGKCGTFGLQDKKFFRSICVCNHACNKSLGSCKLKRSREIFHGRLWKVNRCSPLLTFQRRPRKVEIRYHLHRQDWVVLLFLPTAVSTDAGSLS